MISKPYICLFWVLCLFVGLFEVIFTPLKEAGIIAIYMSTIGLLREASFNKKKPETFYTEDDFIQTGKY